MSNYALLGLDLCGAATGTSQMGSVGASLMIESFLFHLLGVQISIKTSEFAPLSLQISIRLTLSSSSKKLGVVLLKLTRVWRKVIPLSPLVTAEPLVSRCVELD